jgi:hypothetical protein
VSDLIPVIIIWQDAAVDPNYDGHLEGVPTVSTVVNKTIGWITKKNKQEIVTVRDITEADNTVRWPYGIPTKMVLEIIELIPKEKENGIP